MFKPKEASQKLLNDLTKLMYLRLLQERVREDIKNKTFDINKKIGDEIIQYLEELIQKIPK